LFFVVVALLAVSPGVPRAQQQAPPIASSAPGAAAAPHSSSGSQTQNEQNPKPAVPENQASIRITTGLVHLVVTVTDRHHDLITDLDEKDFKVLENGSLQKIDFFGRETDLPLRIGLLLDTSNSIRPRLQFEQDAAIDFLNKVIRRNMDMAFLMTFDNEPEIIQDYTGDLSRLTDAIRRQRAGGGTALHDAIYRASEKLSNPPLPAGPDPQVRRVVVVISDGEDNLSDHALSEAIEAAIRSEAAVYTISTNTDWISIDNGSLPAKYNLDPGDKILQQFANETGGRSFFPYRIDDLAQSFQDIGTELRSQYFIGYSPTIPAAQSQYRKILVQTDRKGLTVRTRRGYYASALPIAAAPEPR
jgi:Ca-activated chloride channel family protein